MTVIDKLDDTGFEEFWQAYPKHRNSKGLLRREGRLDAVARWRKLDAEQRAIALRAARNYGAETNATYVMRAERFLNKFYPDFADEAEVDVVVEQYRPDWVPKNAVPDGHGGWQV